MLLIFLPVKSPGRIECQEGCIWAEVKSVTDHSLNALSSLLLFPRFQEDVKS